MITFALVQLIMHVNLFYQEDVLRWNLTTTGKFMSQILVSRYDKRPHKVSTQIYLDK
jgi:hypothetical protein